MTVRHTLALCCLLAACAPGARVTTTPASVPGIRVVEPATGRDLSFDDLVRRVSSADVVFVGEQHDDPETHRLELAILDAVSRSGRPVILSLEMFERDVQSLLNEYLAGRLSETDFLARSRPWDRYITDYRPMVELAKAKGWPVIASNIPRPMASAVGRKRGRIRAANIAMMPMMIMRVRRFTCFHPSKRPQVPAPPTPGASSRLDQC